MENVNHLFRGRNAELWLWFLQLQASGSWPSPNHLIPTTSLALGNLRVCSSHFVSSGLDKCLLLSLSAALGTCFPWSMLLLLVPVDLFVSAPLQSPWSLVNPKSHISEKEQVGLTRKGERERECQFMLHFFVPDWWISVGFRTLLQHWVRMLWANLLLDFF